jgi:hypothetical protein
LTSRNTGSPAFAGDDEEEIVIASQRVARMRARWLAMTTSERLATPSTVITRFRVIQYSRGILDLPEGLGVLDTPLSRGMTFLN